MSISELTLDDLNRFPVPADLDDNLRTRIVKRVTSSQTQRADLWKHFSFAWGPLPYRYRSRT
jgi:hypothetical protein